MTEQLFDVFLAHHSADKPFVREINTKLKQRGLKTWIDEEQIAPGRSFQQAIQQAIPTVKTAAIILGKDGIGGWQNLEIQAFFSQLVTTNKTIIPVLLPGLDKVPEDLAFLQQLRWINFKNVEDRNSLELLIWGITGKRPPQELKNTPLSTTNTETIQPSSFDADTYFNQGFAKSNLGDYEGAIADYNQAIKIKPDYATAYNNRGNAKHNLGDCEGAIADYNQYIKIKPDYADAYCSRGLEKSYLGDHQGAIADYNQAIKIEPDCADAYFFRGNAKAKLGDKKGAIADGNQSLQFFAQQNRMAAYQVVLSKVKKLEKGFWGWLFG
jgi:tetratricopeptide (TPR) repeat protein